MLTPAQLLDYCQGLQLEATAKLRQLEQQQTESQREIDFKAQRITLNVLENLSKAGYLRLREFDPEFAAQTHIKAAYKNAYFLGLFRMPDYQTSLSFVQAQFKARQLQKLSHEAATALRQILTKKQQLSAVYTQLQALEQNLLQHRFNDSQQSQAYLNHILAALLRIARQLGYPQLNGNRPEQKNDLAEQDAQNSNSTLSDLHRQLLMYASWHPDSFSSVNASMNFAEPEFSALPYQFDNATDDKLQFTDPDAACGAAQNQTNSPGTIKTDDSLGCFS